MSVVIAGAVDRTSATKAVVGAVALLIMCVAGYSVAHHLGWWVLALAAVVSGFCGAWLGVRGLQAMSIAAKEDWAKTSTVDGAGWMSGRIFLGGVIGTPLVVTLLVELYDYLFPLQDLISSN